ncbi:hypothetical protein [Hyalangium rubrum]|uniref:Uncharacterized protein n=1 Tax=Hyalangium rubrum TaxID=3103134 RepID=A0ABU5GWB8_9BACT|nr:hypothetical protein [Hyalangium sp. s54d21]MDY7225386.1 hypothetical protein [Hyalangium sp. s54d21]
MAPINSSVESDLLGRIEQSGWNALVLKYRFDAVGGGTGRCETRITTTAPPKIEIASFLAWNCPDPETRDKAICWLVPRFPEDFVSKIVKGFTYSIADRIKFSILAKPKDKVLDPIVFMPLELDPPSDLTNPTPKGCVANGRNAIEEGIQNAGRLRFPSLRGTALRVAHPECPALGSVMFKSELAKDIYTIPRKSAQIGVIAWKGTGETTISASHVQPISLYASDESFESFTFTSTLGLKSLNVDVIEEPMSFQPDGAANSLVVHFVGISPQRDEVDGAWSFIPTERDHNVGIIARQDDIFQEKTFDEQELATCKTDRTWAYFRVCTNSAGTCCNPTSVFLAICRKEGAAPEFYPSKTPPSWSVLQQGKASSAVDRCDYAESEPDERRIPKNRVWLKVAEQQLGNKRRIILASESAQATISPEQPFAQKGH